MKFMLNDIISTIATVYFWSWMCLYRNVYNVMLKMPVVNGLMISFLYKIKVFVIPYLF